MNPLRPVLSSPLGTVWNRISRCLRFSDTYSVMLPLEPKSTSLSIVPLSFVITHSQFSHDHVEVFVLKRAFLDLRGRRIVPSTLTS